MTLFKFQQIKKVYRLSKSETDFISRIPKVYRKAWDGDLKDLVSLGTLPLNAKKQRDQIKDRIKTKLLAIQGEYCIYCGLHFKVVGPPQREHIAYKGKFPEFTFTTRNLVLSCASCNGFEKKSTKDVVKKYNIIYKKCDFSIIHPYFDNFQDHIEMTNEEVKISISAKNNSDKGKNTIEIFKLMEAEQAQNRAAAYLLNEKEEELKALDKNKVKAVVLHKYTF